VQRPRLGGAGARPFGLDAEDGSVWLKSTDPLQAPAIDPNFFDDPDDLEAMVTGFK
jgi:GMC oxidoreductase